MRMMQDSDASGIPLTSGGEKERRDNAMDVEGNNASLQHEEGEKEGGEGDDDEEDDEQEILPFFFNPEHDGVHKGNRRRINPVFAPNTLGAGGMLACRTVPPAHGVLLVGEPPLAPMEVAAELVKARRKVGILLISGMHG